MDQDTKDMIKAKVRAQIRACVAEGIPLEDAADTIREAMREEGIPGERDFPVQVKLVRDLKATMARHREALTFKLGVKREANRLGFKVALARIPLPKKRGTGPGQVREGWIISRAPRPPEGYRVGGYWMETYVSSDGPWQVETGELLETTAEVIAWARERFGRGVSSFARPLIKW